MSKKKEKQKAKPLFGLIVEVWLTGEDSTAVSVRPTSDGRGMGKQTQVDVLRAALHSLEVEKIHESEVVNMSEIETEEK